MTARGCCGCQSKDVTVSAQVWGMGYRPFVWPSTDPAAITCDGSQPVTGPGEPSTLYRTRVEKTEERVWAGEGCPPPFWYQQTTSYAFPMSASWGPNLVEWESSCQGVYYRRRVLADGTESIYNPLGLAWNELPWGWGNAADCDIFHFESDYDDWPDCWFPVELSSWCVYTAISATGYVRETRAMVIMGSPDPQEIILSRTTVELRDPITVDGIADAAIAMLEFISLENLPESLPNFTCWNGSDWVACTQPLDCTTPFPNHRHLALSLHYGWPDGIEASKPDGMGRAVTGCLRTMYAGPYGSTGDYAWVLPVGVQAWKTLVYNTHRTLAHWPQVWELDSYHGENWRHYALQGGHAPTCFDRRLPPETGWHEYRPVDMPEKYGIVYVEDEPIWCS